MRALRLLAAAVLGAAMGVPSRPCDAADAPSKSSDTVVLTDTRIVECNHAERQPDGSYKLSYDHGDVVLPKELVKVAFTQKAGAYEPKDDEERAKVAKGLVPYDGEWILKADRDARVTRRAAEAKKKVEDAKQHREWRNRYKVKTANFEFEYTIAPEIAKNYMDLMETYYSVFTKQFNVSRPPREKLKVCFYHDYETFLEVAGAPYGVIGYYMPGSRRELNFYYDRLRPEETTAVMFHEAQHYLSNLLNLQFHIPHNFSEAFAEYYGGSRWDPVKKTMTVGGLQEGRLTEIQTDIAAGERKPLDKFLRNQLGYDDYTWGWSFVHYMMETPAYAAKFKKFYVALPTAKDIVRTQQDGVSSVSGETCFQAFKKYMGFESVSTLEKDWYDYIDTKLKATTVVGYEEAAFSALNTGRFIRAKRMFNEAIDKGSKNPTVYLRYGKLLAGDAGAIDILKKGLELDPLNAPLYVALGSSTRGLSGADNDTEGKRLIQLGGDLDPNDVDLWMAVQDALDREGGPTAPKGKEGEGNGGGGN